MRLENMKAQLAKWKNITTSLILIFSFVSSENSYAANEKMLSAAAELDIRVISIAGDVTVIYHDRGKEGVPATEGMPLEAGDRLKTGAESRVEVGMDANSVIDLGPNSDLTISSVERKAAAFDLSLGSLLAKIKTGLFGNDGSMEVRTPFAVAAVRGTEFAVENSKDNGANIGVFDE